MLQSRILVIFGFIYFTFLFFYFYPLTTSIVDETAYLSMAYTYQHGAFTYEKVGISSAPASVMIDSNLISRYPPGNSILLLPFTKIHWKFAFIRGYLLMAAGYLIFIIILRHFHLPAHYGLLFLYHPSLILYSRTIMSDIPATIICLIGLLFLVKQRITISGIFFGASVAIRYPTIIIPVALGLIYLYKRNFRWITMLTIGTIIGISPLLFYHLFCFNTVIGPARENIIGFSIVNLFPMLGQFFISLNILYPLLLIIPVFSKLKERWLFFTPAVLFLLLFSFQYYIDTGNNFFETIIRGQRYMLPIIPFLLVPYAEVLNRIRFFNRYIPIFFIILIVISAVIHYNHNRFLNQQSYYQSKLYRYGENAQMIICNKDVYELINPFIKILNWIPFESCGKIMEVKIPEDSKNVYLACLARDGYTKNLFLEFLKRFPEKKEIYTENNPYYFSIWTLQ